MRKILCSLIVCSLINIFLLSVGVANSNLRCENSATDDTYVESNDGVNRRPQSIKDIDYCWDIPTLCNTNGTRSFILTKEKGKDIDFNKTWTCGKCFKGTISVKYTFAKPMLAYIASAINENVELSVNVKKCNECSYKPSVSKNINLSAIVKDYYEEVSFPEISQTGDLYYVKKDMLDDLGIENHYRVLFSAPGDLIVFNPSRVDLYHEVERGYVDLTYTQKFGIYPLYNDVKIANSDGGESQPINQGKFIDSNKVFFVCEFCKTCNVCNNAVASTGATLGATPNSLEISKYCAENHACGFFWDIDNGGFMVSSIENVNCWNNMRLEGSPYCKRHKCENCYEPVVGINLGDPRFEILEVYQGENTEFYSHFCVTHFCQANMCMKERINPDIIQHDVINGKCCNFTIYCNDHCSVCGVCGKNEVSIGAYNSNGYKAVCEYCKKLLINAEAKRCINCGNTFLSKNCIEYEGNFVCNICLATLRLSKYKTIYDDNIVIQVGDNKYLTVEDLKNNFELPFLDQLLPNGYTVGIKDQDFKQAGQSYSSKKYSDENIGKSGCGLVSLAMCTGLSVEYLYDIYENNGRGTAGIDLYEKLARLASFELVITNDHSTVEEYLKMGGNVMAHCCRSDKKQFLSSKSGHYMALTESYGNEEVMLNNPGTTDDGKNGRRTLDWLEEKGVDEYILVIPCN